MLPVAAEDVSVTEPPEQNVVGPEVNTEGTAGPFVTLTTVAVEELLQPLALVTVTE